MAKTEHRATVKHSGGHVMIWGCMAYNGVGSIALIDGTMNASNYIEVLHSNISCSVLKLAINDSYHFQQDNDPKHNAKNIREWLLYNVRRRLITPPQSLDINLIENLWHLLDLELRKRKISGKSDLKRVISEEWLKNSCRND
jgi:hypothetical protein